MPKRPAGQDASPEGTRPDRHLQLFEVHGRSPRKHSSCIVSIILRFTSSQGDTNVATHVRCPVDLHRAESDAEECPAAAMLVTEVEVVGYFLT